VKKILIFRTDRIGDFLVCAPIYMSLKRNKYIIDIVCSNKNYEYVNSINFFNKVFLYPQTFINKILFLLRLKKYDEILVLDGKKRSIYIALLKICENKILFTPSKFIHNLFGFFFDKIIHINYNKPKIDFLVDTLNFLNCDFIKSDLNFLKYNSVNQFKTYKIGFDKYIVLNFDEKWIFKNYISTYSNIEPSIKDFIKFINKLSNKKNLIITNGLIKNPILHQIKVGFIDKLNKNILIKDQIDIFELEYLIKNSDALISCHGAPSHIASNHSIKIVDIIDKSEINFFESYNFHFRNKSQLLREDFDILSNKIFLLF
tara:strand:- start:644 stop:1591 length:948 start_codon:yes stop_codon:yes gene_type:complete